MNHYLNIFKSKPALLIISICSFLFLFQLNLIATEKLNNSKHFISYKTHFIQFKDEFNYGLIFNGVNFGGEYSFEQIIDDNILSYKAELAFGANVNQGIGVNWRIVPIDIFYGFEINEKTPFTLGAYFSTNYNWQLYP